MTKYLRSERTQIVQDPVLLRACLRWVENLIEFGPARCRATERRIVAHCFVQIDARTGQSRSFLLLGHVSNLLVHLTHFLMF